MNKLQKIDKEYPGTKWFAGMVFFIWFTAFINANSFDVSWAWASAFTAGILGVTGVVFSAS